MKARGGDTLEQVALVVLLVAGLVLNHRFAVPDGPVDPRALLAVGFVILVSRTVGEWVGRLGLPHISGYLLTGLLLGESFASWAGSVGPALPPPFDAGVITTAIRVQLTPIEGLSLALIALSAGGEIRLAELRADLPVVSRLLGRVGLAVGGSVFAATAALLWGPGLPGLASDLSTATRLSIAAVVAAIAVGTSPAITLAVLRDSGARGPVARRVLTTVVLSDVLVGVLFALATAALATATGGADASPWSVPVALGGALVLGSVLAGAFHGWMEWVGAEVLLFVVGLLALGDAAAHGLRFDGPLTFIVGGFLLTNGSRHGEAVLREVRRLSAPMFVAFFTLAGAKLDLRAIGGILPAAVGLALLRAGALGVATRASAADGLSPLLARSGWMGLVSQAGLAIGLANLVALRFPDVGPPIYALVLGVVALNEAVGPASLLALLRRAGEVPGPSRAGASDEVDFPAGVDAPRWSVPLRSGSPALDAAAEEVEGRLLRALAEVRDGPVAVAADQRRAFAVALLGTARAADEVCGAEGPDAAARALRPALGTLLRSRAAELDAASGWTPMDLVRHLDGVAAALPEVIEAPWPAGSLEARAEGPLPALSRWSARRRARFGGLRPVPVRAVVRSHLTGRAPGRIEPAVALALDVDARQVAEASAAAGRLLTAWERADPVGARAAVGEIELLSRAIDGDTAAVVARLDRAFLGFVVRIREDLWRAGLPGYGPLAWRPGRHFRARAAALTRLGPQLEVARHDVACGIEERAATLAVEEWERAARARVEEEAVAVERDARALAGDVEGTLASCRLAVERTVGMGSGDAVEGLRAVAATLRQASVRVGNAATLDDSALLHDLRVAAQGVPEHAWAATPTRGDHSVPEALPARRTEPRARVLQRIDGPLAAGQRAAMERRALDLRQLEGALREAADAVALVADVAGAAPAADFDGSALVAEPARASLRRLEAQVSAVSPAAAAAAIRAVGAGPTRQGDGAAEVVVPPADRLRNVAVRQIQWLRNAAARGRSAGTIDPGPLAPVPEAYRRLFAEMDAVPFELAGLWPTLREELASASARGPVALVGDDDALNRALWQAATRSASVPARAPWDGPLGVWSRVAWAHRQVRGDVIGVVRVPVPTAEELARLLLARHQASGLDLWPVPEREAAVTAYVFALHRASSGSLRAAAAAWVAGLGLREDGTLWFRPEGIPDRLEPPEDGLLLLRVGLRDASTEPGAAAEALGEPRNAVAGRIELLAATGWLAPEGDGWVVPDARRMRVHAALEARGWA